jgi:hypothetical protein
MLNVWPQDIESLEAISQDESTRRIFLRMAAMSQAGRMNQFLVELNADHEIDAETKGTLSELAQDRSFLLAVEDYLRKTHRFH